MPPSHSFILSCPALVIRSQSPFLVCVLLFVWFARADGDDADKRSGSGRLRAAPHHGWGGWIKGGEGRGRSECGISRCSSGDVRGRKNSFYFFPRACVPCVRVRVRTCYVGGWCGVVAVWWRRCQWGASGGWRCVAKCVAEWLGRLGGWLGGRTVEGRKLEGADIRARSADARRLQVMR